MSEEKTQPLEQEEKAQKEELAQGEDLEQEEVKAPSLEEENSALKQKISELEDRYLRANAEFENLRKRLEKEKFQAIAYAHEQFAKDLLPVIDALEIAASTDMQSEEAAGKIQEGIALTIDQFKKCFEKHGVSAVGGTGEFDPNVHEAVMQIDSPGHESGKIVQVFQKGYTIKERVLRPAMVSISK